ncbi:MAG: hypothetical protein ABJG78_19100 [Cyclobacteriaceae bacterium]
MLYEMKMNEVDVAADLIRGGFASAKNSMEQILRTPIAVERIEHDDYAMDRFMLNGGDEVHLLKTELRGELAGACYLLFTSDEVGKINKACLPDSILENRSPENELMKIEFLKEFDNMLSAAVITEFANFLGILLYGDVPSLDIISTFSLAKYLDGETEKFDNVIHLRAIFHGPELAISPHFIWAFQGELLDKIKNTSNN